jgi:hypothetical protein
MSALKRKPETDRRGKGPRAAVKDVSVRRPRKSSAQPEGLPARGDFPALARIAAVGTQLRRHPYGTLGATVGLGYVLGGGVFTSLTSRLVRLGLRAGTRLALVALVADHVARLITAPAAKHQNAKHTHV